MSVKAIEELLLSEMACVTGCTEPASVAFAFRTARRHLSAPFEPRLVQARLRASRGVLRNASTAVVPFLNRRGLRSAVAAGLASQRDRFDLFPGIELPVAEALLRRRSWLQVAIAEDKKGIHVAASLDMAGETVVVIIDGRHDEVHSISRDGIDLFRAPPRRGHPIMSMKEIHTVASARNPRLEEIARDFIVQQARGDPALPMPKRIAELIHARMTGSPIPIMTIGGSGNHGILLGLPLYDLYRKRGERALAAILFALLTDIRMTEQRSRVADECGLGTKAAPALAAGWAYADGADFAQIEAIVESVSSALPHVKCHGARTTCGQKGLRAYTTAMNVMDQAITYQAKASLK